MKRAYFLTICAVAIWPTESFAEITQRKAAEILNDCLAKAVAKQIPGRPINPLVRDLMFACGGEIGMWKTASGKTTQDAYWSHIAPAALRARPTP